MLLGMPSVHCCFKRVLFSCKPSALPVHLTQISCYHRASQIALNTHFYSAWWSPQCNQKNGAAHHKGDTSISCAKSFSRLLWLYRIKPQGSIQLPKHWHLVPCEIHKGNLPGIKTPRSKVDLSPISYLANLCRCFRCHRTSQTTVDSYT